METLRFGSRGAAVSQLQLALQKAGFSPGNIDGVFGINTQNAVRRFQSANRLTPDGIVGAKTWAALMPYLSGYVSYTIRPGDTFYKLAQAFNTTDAAIQAANPTVNAYNLKVGSTIWIPTLEDIITGNVLYSSGYMETALTALRERYPFIRIGTYGSSVMGKPLYYASIGRGKKEAFYNASHHANEWITTPVLMRFLEEYASAYASGKEVFDIPAKELYDAATLYIAPMVNPDGVDLVTGAIIPGSPYYDGAVAIAEEFPAIPFPNGWKANIVGTDLNLKYPAGWEQAKQNKERLGFTRPAPRDYVGPAPLSAQESRAVYDFTLAHDFALTLSYHSQGEVIYWNYLDMEPPRSFEIAQRLGEVSGYTVERTPPEASYAGYKDWFILHYNRPGYTSEVGKGVNPRPISQFADIYRDNLGILAVALEEAGKL